MNNRSLDVAAAASPRPWGGFACALIGSVAFAGKAIIVKLAYRHDVDAITLVMYRMLIALPLFLLLAWWAGRGQSRLSLRQLFGVALMGLLGYYLSSTLDFLGLMYISASLERLILYLTPTLVLLIGVIAFKRPVARAQWLTLAVSYAGVLLAFGHELQVVGTNVPLGAALVFGSTFTYALYLSGVGELVGGLGALRLTGWAGSVASVLCIAQFLVVKPLAAAQVAEPVVWLSLLNGTACTVAPVLLVMMAVERIGASMTAQIGMVGPLATIVMSVLILGEPFTPWIAAGTALVLLGVGLLSQVRARPRDAAAAAASATSAP